MEVLLNTNLFILFLHVKPKYSKKISLDKVQKGWMRMSPFTMITIATFTITNTPSVFIYMSYQVCPKSNLANFDQVYRKKYSNNYTTEHMHYQRIFHGGFNDKFGTVNVINFFSYKFGQTWLNLTQDKPNTTCK